MFRNVRGEGQTGWIRRPHNMYNVHYIVYGLLHWDFVKFTEWMIHVRYNIRCFTLATYSFARKQKYYPNALCTLPGPRLNYSCKLLLLSSVYVRSNSRSSSSSSPSYIHMNYFSSETHLGWAQGELLVAVVGRRCGGRLIDFVPRRSVATSGAASR